MNITSPDIKKLLEEQVKDWELAGANFKALSSVQTKEFDYGTFKIKVQFNPARIQSTAAKVDTKSIQERKCFLCPENLPAVQKGIAYGTEYQILVNPFPIFPQHFTIPAYKHTDQLILGRYGDMLDLAKSLEDYTIFYNGPKCGASAPDHIHFQAGNKGFMPIEKDILKIDKELIKEDSVTKIYALRNYLRNGFLIEAKEKSASVGTFIDIYSLLEIKEGEKEPMMNIIAWFEDGVWYTCVFPRQNHRPKCFFAEGDANILISPASVDMGGVFITPQEKDFNKITANDIKDILQEVCIDDNKLQELIMKIKNQS